MSIIKLNSFSSNKNSVYYENILSFLNIPLSKKQMEEHNLFPLQYQVIGDTYSHEKLHCYNLLFLGSCNEKVHAVNSACSLSWKSLTTSRKFAV